MIAFVIYTVILDYIVNKAIEITDVSDENEAKKAIRNIIISILLQIVFIAILMLM